MTPKENSSSLNIDQASQKIGHLWLKFLILVNKSSPLGKNNLD